MTLMVEIFVKGGNIHILPHISQQTIEKALVVVLCLM